MDQSKGIRGYSDAGFAEENRQLADVDWLTKREKQRFTVNGTDFWLHVTAFWRLQPGAPSGEFFGEGFISRDEGGTRFVRAALAALRYDDAGVEDEFQLINATGVRGANQRLMRDDTHSVHFRTERPNCGPVTVTFMAG